MASNSTNQPPDMANTQPLPPTGTAYFRKVEDDAIEYRFTYGPAGEAALKDRHKYESFHLPTAQAQPTISTDHRDLIEYEDVGPYNNCQRVVGHHVQGQAQGVQTGPAPQQTRKRVVPVDGKCKCGACGEEFDDRQSRKDHYSPTTCQDHDYGNPWKYQQKYDEDWQ